MNPPANKLDKTISQESDNPIENNAEINRQQINAPLMDRNFDNSFEVESVKKLNLSQENMNYHRKRTLTYTLQNNPSFKARLNMDLMGKQQVKKKYNPFRSPPDIVFAKKHGRSRRVCKKKDVSMDSQMNQSETCPCCGYDIDNEQFEMCTDPNNFAHLGTCFPLYFNFVKQCFMFITIQFAIQALPSLIINYNVHDISDKCKDQSFICTFSFLNLMNSSNYDAIRIESILNFVTIIIQLFVIEFFKIYQKSLKVYLEKDRVTVSDYSVMFQKLPLDITVQELENYLEDTHQGSKENIVRIFMLYDIERYTKNYQLQQKLYKQNLAIQHQIHTVSNNEKLTEEEKQSIIDRYTRDSNMIESEIKKITKDKSNLEKKMKKEIIQSSNSMNNGQKQLYPQTIIEESSNENLINLSQKKEDVKLQYEGGNINQKTSTEQDYENFTSNDENLEAIISNKSDQQKQKLEKLNNPDTKVNESLVFSGNAIITFNSYEVRKKIQHTLKPQNITEVFYTYINRFCITWCKRRYENIIAENKLERFVLNNRLVRLQKAPEPSDILWNNIGSVQSKIKLRIQTYVVVYFLLFVVCVLLALLKYFIQQIQDDYKGQVSSLWIIALTLAGSSAVAGGNVVIGIVIRSYTAREKRKTQTDYFVNTGNKLTNMFAVNMILTTIFSNITTYFAVTNKDGTTPLNMQNIINTYFFLFITNSYLSSLFSIFDIVWGWRLLKRWRIVNSEKVRNTTTQEEANKTFEDHPVDMALRYANILKNVQFTCAVSPLIPLGVPMCLIGLFIIYWVDKYLLIRRWVCSNFLQHILSKEMLKQMNMAVVYFALGNMLTMFMPTTKDIVQDGEQNWEWQWPNFFQSGFFYLALLGVVISLFINYSPFKKASIYSLYYRFTNQGDSDTKRQIDESFVQVKSEILNLDDYDHYHPVYQNYTKRHILDTKMSIDLNQEQDKSSSYENYRKSPTTSNLQFMDIEQREEKTTSLENYSVFNSIQQSFKD